MKLNGDKVAGKKIEIIYRDDGGSNVELSKRAAQELIGREKVSFLVGFSLTPSALAVAPVATQGKVPMIVMNAVTTGITAKSPYMLRTSMTMQQMTEPFGTWTAQNKIGRVYSLVSDYSTGVTTPKSCSRRVLLKAAARSSVPRVPRWPIPTTRPSSSA
jgi:branched-chain amino acid transport system substrate-binding protein